jgi:hypothetical protein
MRLSRGIRVRADAVRGGWYGHRQTGIRSSVRMQTQAYLADGAGFRVSPASVVNIRRQAMAGLDRQAA